MLYGTVLWRIHFCRNLRTSWVKLFWHKPCLCIFCLFPCLPTSNTALVEATWVEFVSRLIWPLACFLFNKKLVAERFWVLIQNRVIKKDRFVICLYNTTYLHITCLDVSHDRCHMSHCHYKTELAKIQLKHVFPTKLNEWTATKSCVQDKCP